MKTVLVDVFLVLVFVSWITLLVVVPMNEWVSGLLTMLVSVYFLAISIKINFDILRWREW